MYKFHFHIPNYVGNSNGIQTLWEAAYQFSLLRNVTLSSFYHGEKKSYEIPSKYCGLIKPQPVLDEETIVIYPDAVHGNPLNAIKVARYMMAKEYILNGNPIAFGEDDFIFSYSNAVNSNVAQYNILLDNLKGLKDFRVPKIPGKVSIYYGKCRVAMDTKRYVDLLKKFQDVSVITRANPSSKSDLYSEIASSELLISFDSLSSLSYESTLLGTPVLLMDDVSKYFYETFNYKLHGFYYQGDISRIDKIIRSHEDLFNISNQELLAQLSLIPQLTSSIIQKIEEYFATPEKSLKAVYQKDDLDFFINCWRCSPIVNCTSLKTVYGFHLLKGMPRLYYFLRSAHLYFYFLKNQLKQFRSKYLYPPSLFPGNEFDCLKYSTDAKKYIVNFKKSISEPINNSVEQFNILKAYKMKTSKFLKILRFVCT